MRVEHEHERGEVEHSVRVVRRLEQARRRPAQRRLQRGPLAPRHAGPGHTDECISGLDLAQESFGATRNESLSALSLHAEDERKVAKKLAKPR